MCAGTNHGARKRIEWARELHDYIFAPIEPIPSSVWEIRDTQKSRIEEYLQAYKTPPNSDKFLPRKPTTKFFECLRTVEIVNRLSLDEENLTLSKICVDAVSTACLDVLSKEVESDAAIKKLARRLSDHFWCDVFAALARALDLVLSAYDKIKDKIADGITEFLVNMALEDVLGSRAVSGEYDPRTQKETFENRPTRAQLDKQAGLTKAIIKKLILRLVDLLLDSRFANLRMVILQAVGVGPRARLERYLFCFRLLAILYCPSPFPHKEVWEYCLRPFLKAGLESELSELYESIEEYFDRDWELTVSLETLKKNDT